MYFDDRLDAARQLADALRKYEGAHPLVLAIPRGSVPMGRVLAQALGGELDVVLPRKADAPATPDLAAGYVQASGWTHVPSDPRLDPRGRVVIVIDDGLATGETMTAALQAVHALGPARLVCAVPVASREALSRIQAMADEIVCLATPVEFGGIARFYRDFTAVTDDAVAQALAATRSPAIIAP